MSNYPEHDKLKVVQPQSQAIHEFVFWLQDEHGVCFAEYPSPGSDRLSPWNKPLTDVVAEFFDVDQAKLENEKREMLEVFAKCRSTEGDGT